MSNYVRCQYFIAFTLHFSILILLERVATEEGLGSGCHLCPNQPYVDAFFSGNTISLLLLTSFICCYI